MKFAICNEMFEGWEIEKIFECAASLGYQGVEVAPFTLAESVTDISPARRAEIRKSAEANGLAVAGLHWLLVSPEGLYMNHPDPAIRGKTKDYFLALIDCCGDLGGHIMVIGSPKQRNVMDGHSYEETWQLTVDTFSQCVDRAASRDVTLCMEPLPMPEANFINTAADAAKMVEEMNHPNFKLILDVKSMSAEGRPLDQIIAENATTVAHVHANDANRRGPGAGDTDFAPVFRALKEIDYAGYVSVEVFDFKPDPETIARESIEYMRSVA